MRYRFVVAVGLAWLVLLIFELVTGMQLSRGHRDFVTNLFAPLSEAMHPVRVALMRAAEPLTSFGAGLVPGLTIGDTSRVTEELDVAMKQSSLTHLVAVSGANCQIVTAVAFAVLSLLGLPRWGRIVGAIAVLVAFVGLVTPQPSVTRAAVMSVSVLIGLTLGRLSRGLPALALAVAVLLCVEPLWAREYGFVLSVLATAGLLTLSRPLSVFLSRWLPSWLARAAAIPLSASLLCQPVIVLLSPALPTYGVLANLLAEPAAGVATILGLVACALAVIWLPLGQLAAWVAWVPAEWIGQIAVSTASWPFARLPWLSSATGLLLAAVLSAGFIVAVVAPRRRWRRVAAITAGVILTGSVTVALTQTAQGLVGVPADWVIAACDVGQGDAVLVRSQDRNGVVKTGLIDTGRRPDLLRACLGRLGVSRLDLLVLTHYDLDHVGGTAAVNGKVELALVGQPENLLDQNLIAGLSNGGAHVERGIQGISGALGEMSWSVLWPDTRTPDMQVGNPGSITMILRWPQLSAAFLGDLGAAAQESLLSSMLDIGQVDVLKVAHHGSADTSAALTARLHPRVALISVGADNGYGHPTRKALDMLASQGALVARTDREGMLFVVVRNGKLVLVTDR